MNNPKTLARMAGGLYLLVAVLGGWAQLVARGAIHVRGDAAATARNIVENEALFRLSITADVVMALVFTALGLTLWRLLSAEGPRSSVAMMIFMAVGSGIVLVNLTFQVGALVVATDAAPGAANDALALLLLDLHQYGYTLCGIFFGLWLLPVGYVAYRSELFPKALGVIVLAAGIIWLVDPVVAFVLPDTPQLVRDLIVAPTAIGEFTLVFYLLIVGVRTRRPALAEAAPRR